MRFHRGLNYPANCGPYFASVREVDHPLQDNGSAGDQSEYRAKLERYQDLCRVAGWPTSVAPEPYVPPSWPRCTKRCIPQNGYHPRDCPESNR